MRNPLKRTAKKSIETKPNGVAVDKVEVADSKVKFFAAKGIGKKRWIVIKEIAFDDITSIDEQDSKLAVTWRDGVEVFFTKNNPDEFSKAIEEISKVLAERRQTSEVVDKATLRRNELMTVVNTSLEWVNGAFDVLMGLQEKHVNWPRLETAAASLLTPLEFSGQTLPLFSLDFAKVSAAIKKEASKDTSKEAFDVLKAVNNFFGGFTADSEVVDAKPTLESAKTVMCAYFVLNDLLLGKLVGDVENAKENSEFDRVLHKMCEGNFNVNIEELLAQLAKMDARGDWMAAVEECRRLFLEQVKPSL